MKKNLLVTLADKNYIKQVKQLFSSVYFNAGWKGDYMLLADNIPEKDLKWFRKKGILIKKCSLASSKFGKRWHPTILNKIYLFTPYFKKWKNIVFLDGDIIVRTSLEELTKINGFAASETHKKISKLLLSPTYIKLEKKPLNKYKILKSKYDFNSPCFSTGLMAFSTNIIKKDMFPRLLKHHNLYTDLSASADEPIINMLFYKKWIKLPSLYQTCPRTLMFSCKIKPQKIKGAIIHFVLKPKPWDKGHPFNKEWESNLEKSNLIDLKNRPDPRKTYTQQEIYNYEKNLKKRRRKYFYRQIILNIIRFSDKKIGEIGSFLKNNSPRLYYKLKRIIGISN